MGLDGRQQGLRIGEGVGHGLAAAHGTGKVHQQQVGTAPPDLDADRKSTIRIECHGHRRLANAAAQRFVANQQPVVFKAGGDQANGLGGKAREACNFGLGQAAVEADGMQHHALVELAHADMVGAPWPQHGRCARTAVAPGEAQAVRWFSKVHRRRVSPITPLRSRKLPNGCCSPVKTMAKALLVRS